MPSPVQSATDLGLWIEHPVHPSRLILAWEAPPAASDRKRWAIGELLARGSETLFRYYRDDEFLRANDYRSPSTLHALGYRGYPAFPLSVEIHTSRVLEAFGRRLPPENRSDYDEFLQYYRYRSAPRPLGLAILGATGAKLPGDGFSLIDPLDQVEGDADLILELAGSRHYQRTPMPAPWQIVQFFPEPDNQFDPRAIRVDVEQGVLGYLNRLQAPKFRTLLDDSAVKGWFLRANGTADRPRALLFVRARPHASTIAA